MNFITLHNPTEETITDYKIEEIDFDQDGKVMLDSEGRPKKTGRTLEWSIGPGETLKFPEYVGNYLKEVYAFLELSEESVEQDLAFSPSPTSETTFFDTNEMPAKPKEGTVNCQKCGQNFGGIRGLALHKAIKHPDEILR